MKLRQNRLENMIKNTKDVNRKIYNINELKEINCNSVETKYYENSK